MAYINRVTGEVDGDLLDRVPPGAVGLALAPNGSSLLIAVVPEGDSGGELGLRRFSFKPLKVDAAEPQTALEQEARALVGDAPQLQWLLQTAHGYADDKSTIDVADQPIKIQLYNIAEGETKDLRDLARGDGLLGLAWSQDSNRLALGSVGLYDYSKLPRQRDFLRYDGALISEQVYRDVTGNLPKDQNPFFTRNVIDTFDLNSGARKTLKAADLDGVLINPSSWSPDQQTLLVEAYDPGVLAGRRYPVYDPQFAQRVTWRFYNNDLKETGRLAAPLVSAPVDNYGFFVTPDEVIFNVVDATDTKLVYYNRVSGELRELDKRPGTDVRVHIAYGARQVVFTHTSFSEPPDMFRVSWSGEALYRLTWVNEELRAYSTSRQYPVSFTLTDGKTYRGVLALPGDVSFPPKNVPIVVYQEGGPGGSMINAWAAIVERPYALLPNFGFGVLMVPLAGRYGNGPQVYNALYDGANFGSKDVDQQAEIARQMISRGWTSQKKLGIVGCSYGGYFTLQSTIRHPELYAASNPQCSLVDAVSEWTRGYASLMPYIEGVPPWANVDEYRRDSPLYNAATIKTPTLMFQGTNDFLPITLGENTPFADRQRWHPGEDAAVQRRGPRARGGWGRLGQHPKEVRALRGAGAADLVQNLSEVVTAAE